MQQLQSWTQIKNENHYRKNTAYWSGKLKTFKCFHISGSTLAIPNNKSLSFVTNTPRFPSAIVTFLFTLQVIRKVSSH